MTHTYFHAQSSARTFGGEPEDYLDIHRWFDATKQHFCDFRHRALRHHSEGIFECEEVFGVTIVNSAERQVPVRYIGEQHCLEDMSRVPSLRDWLELIAPENWMTPGPSLSESPAFHAHTRAVESARIFGGEFEDYLPIHRWFDAHREAYADFRHRAMRHHAEGIYEAERVFGVTIANRDGVHVPVHCIGEQHVTAELGRVPSVKEWLELIQPKVWMARASKVKHGHRVRRVA